MCEYNDALIPCRREIFTLFKQCSLKKTCYETSNFILHFRQPETDFHACLKLHALSYSNLKPKQRFFGTTLCSNLYNMGWRPNRNCVLQNCFLTICYKTHPPPWVGQPVPPGLLVTTGHTVSVTYTKPRCNDVVSSHV